MTDRVLLDQNRVSISRAGKDVKTVGISDMIWDSRANEYGAVFMTGTINPDPEVGYQVIIPFGRTLARIPYVWVMGRESSTNTWMQFGANFDNNNGSLTVTGVTAYASTTQVKINMWSTFDVVRYVVFNIGAA